MEQAPGGPKDSSRLSQRTTPGQSHEEFESFIHNVVHDLRSPLVTIESMVLLLRDSAEDRLRKEEIGYLDHVENGARLMRDLLGDLSELTLIKRSVEKPIDILTKELVERTIAEMSADVARVSGQVAIVGDLPHVHGDRDMVQQIFRRLIENSLKFHQPDQTPCVSVSGTAGSEFHEFAVTDNGIGIPPHFQERIFGIFTKLHPRTRYSGNGIGLAIVKRCVEGHGGSVRLESAEGQGTTMRFTLPA